MYDTEKSQSRNFNKYCREAFQKYLQSISWEDTLKQTNVYDACSAFTEVFLNVLNTHGRIVERNVRGRDIPWLNNAMKRQRQYKSGTINLKKAQPGVENIWST